jgi:serpin B
LILQGVGAGRIRVPVVQSDQNPRFFAKERKMIRKDLLLAAGSPVAALVLACFVLSCGGSTDPSGPGDASWRSIRSDLPRETSPDATEGEVDALARGGAEFACDLHSRLPRDENLLFSPTSIRIAFAMVHAGARGETEEEMGLVLRFPADGSLHRSWNAVDLALASRNLPPGDEGEDAVELRLANAFWARRGYAFRTEYLDVLGVNYGAGVEELDFAESEDARAVINGWVEERTEDRVRNLLPAGSVDANTVAVLTNALFFKAPWHLPFDEDLTASGTFTRPDGSLAAASMMRRTETYGYAEEEGAQALEMTYRGGELSMVLFLPPPGSFSSFESGLSVERLSGLVDALAPSVVDVSVPRFTFRSEFRLRDMLMEMGMVLAFTDADLGGMAENAGLVIDEAYHKTFIDVNEKGTEAAAATAVTIRDSALVPEHVFAADRPFLFVIRDRSTGEVLFFGRVTDPSA